MRKADWILIITAAISFFNVGVIWMMQLLFYPLWRFVGEREWKVFHLEHWKRVKYAVFIPVGLYLTGSILLLFYCPTEVPKLLIWINIVLQGVTHTLTGTIWAPLQVRLAKEGADSNILTTLIVTHWGRTLLVTANGFVMLDMVARLVRLS